MTNKLPASYSDELKLYVCRVKFTKANGEKRIMYCTLNKDVLPVKESANVDVQTRESNPDVVAVWDTQAAGWRSFRKDSVEEFHVV